MHSRCPNFFPFWVGVWREVFFHFPSFPKCSDQVLIGFPSCFQFDPHVLIVFPNMFPIAPFFNPTCFGKCCPPLTYIGGPKGRNTTLILLWGLLQLSFISSISLPLRTGMEFSFHGLYRLLTLRKVFSLLGQSNQFIINEIVL
jgi:hypothetical protein